MTCPARQRKGPSELEDDHATVVDQEVLGESGSLSDRMGTH